MVFYSFLALKRTVLVNVITFVLLQALAVIGFLDISVVWIGSSRAGTLNRRLRKKEFRRFKYIVRILELSYFITLLTISIRLAKTSGQSYSLLNSILVFSLSFLIIVLFILGRRGLRAILSVKSGTLSLDPKVKRYWSTIRNVSSVVIAANFGILLVQVFYMLQVQNFNELVKANNNTVVLSLLLFQYICIFSGQIAIFAYLGGVYQNFRSSLFDESKFSKFFLISF